MNFTKKLYESFENVISNLRKGTLGWQAGEKTYPTCIVCEPLV